MNWPRAVFLDRDGTLIEERDYLSRAEDVLLYPGAGAALARLQKAEFQLFIVSNQSGVGRGFFTMADVEKVNARLIELLQAFKVELKKIYIAPEAPGTPSRGRKPSPQFLFDARDEFQIDLAQSYMIGDKWIDVECGWNAGVRKSILVRTGYGKKAETTPVEQGRDVIIMDDLTEASAWILAQNPVASTTP